MTVEGTTVICKFATTNSNAVCPAGFTQYKQFRATSGCTVSNSAFFTSNRVFYCGVPDATLSACCPNRRCGDNRLSFTLSSSAFADGAPIAEASHTASGTREAGNHHMLWSAQENRITFSGRGSCGDHTGAAGTSFINVKARTSEIGCV